MYVQIHASFDNVPIHTRRSFRPPPCMHMSNNPEYGRGIRRENKILSTNSRVRGTSPNGVYPRQIRCMHTNLDRDISMVCVCLPSLNLATITWTLSTSGVYSAKSAYKAQFIGASSCSFMSIVWKTWAPPKCSFFAWLAVQNRLWTSDRHAIRGWPHQPLCQLCRCHPETGRHLLFECRYSKRIWSEASIWLHCPSIMQSQASSKPTILDYWKDVVAMPSPSRKGMKTAVILITWEIWKERNARIFNNKYTTPSATFQRIKTESKNWILAGAKMLAESIG